MKKKHRKILCYMVILVLVLLLTSCGQNENVDPREKEVVQLVVNERYNEAIEKAKELYKNQELEEMLQWINKHKNINEKRKEKINDLYTEETKKILKIQPHHNSKIKNNYYYITGRVKNIGDNNINYFEVRCDFLDKSKKVLNSKFTNDNLILKPGEMREFKIIVKYNNDYKSYRLSVGDVK